MENNWKEIKPNMSEAWNGKALDPNSSIDGEYVQKKTEVGPNKSNMYTLRQENGEAIDVWGSTVIDSRFAMVKEGSYVKITFLGEKQGKRGAYKDYALFVRENASTGQTEAKDSDAMPTLDLEDEIKPEDLPF